MYVNGPKRFGACPRLSTWLTRRIFDLVRLDLDTYPRVYGLISRDREHLSHATSTSLNDPPRSTERQRAELPGPAHPNIRPGGISQAARSCAHPELSGETVP